MIAKVYAGVTHGPETELIEVETGLLKGLSNFQIVGLPDKSIEESKERLNLALRSIGAKPPLRFNARTIVNLAPGDIKKEGSLLDLAIALSFLIASEQLTPRSNLQETLFLGEIGLDGQLRRIPGVLPIILGAQRQGFRHFCIPTANAFEVQFLRDLNIYPCASLLEVINHLEGSQQKPTLTTKPFAPQPRQPDLSALRLPEPLWRVLTVVAAGRHNLLLSGPPGTGKTLIAHALNHILPPLTYDEALEVTSLYSACGQLKEEFLAHTPFRHPHHTASSAAIMGGGQSVQPGEISLAHRGLLFLDELPEFRRDVLEGLREPLEQREITVARAQRRVTFPANFLFVGAYNPCPCGFAGDPKQTCTCSMADIRRYQKKLSGPILDRLDVFLFVPRIDSQQIFKKSLVDLPAIQARIATLKEQQLSRQAKYNGELTPKELEKFCACSPEAQNYITTAADRFSLSLRAVHKLLRVARTIADLEEAETLTINHLAEALQYRQPTPSI